MTDLYIGLMSGTSLDGIDAVLVDFASGQPRLTATLSHPIPATLRRQLLDLCRPGANEIERMGQADTALGELFAEAVQCLLEQAAIPAQDIRAIGSHGQTIRHLPQSAFTLQIGDASRIAQRTGITTVADFRRRDMAAGGQGAPLVPAFHAALFRSPACNRAVLNLGGMANLTLLPAADNTIVSGFDTGPGNVLMDLWTQRHLGQALDEGGSWAAGGTADADLLRECLNDAYFRQAPPKSTGREHFNADWLDTRIRACGKPIRTQDVQATLCELTALSVTQALRDQPLPIDELLVCGGGARNRQLLSRLDALLSPLPVAPCDNCGLGADWVEAVAFAWLARETLAGRPGNLPAVTGASEAVVLGAIYPA